MKVSWEQVFAWRMRRQYLDPRTTRPATEIVSRLCGVQAQVASAAETAVGLRRSAPERDGVAGALADRSLMKTWAMRGTLHLLRPSEAGAYLSLLETGGFWRKPSWQRVAGVTPEQIDELTEKVGDVLDGAVLTRDQLVTEIVRDERFAGLETQLRSGWGQVLKPLAWRGVLCHGPNQGSRITFTNPASQFPEWKQRPEPDEAAPAVIAAYLGAYGPATPEAFDGWLSRNGTSRPRLRRWFADLGDTLTEVDVEGRRTLILTEHADELADTPECTTVRLLGGFDQYVLGTGTNDEALLAKAHRAAVSRTAGWISPIVVVNGRIVGVWEVLDGEIVLTPFPGADPVPPDELARETAHVARAMGL
ncbi:winged helix DNA-binding domain-containing protein [Cryptosporangium aurantiacum]|uniref:Winged helix DNA-binding domain-containing protein n=1 Tax=Cryptosporangium aurantiacum TaxID=134849 RepID=A0A1M7J807_9ACTN|nr:winged helix DNA-binding domain-containing protein [Cryptosporangium aurantiacum]SHM49112.1 Winged helix DNA-binding domain-containing protein [Cryptosporangium aurantiacum]